MSDHLIHLRVGVLLFRFSFGIAMGGTTRISYRLAFPVPLRAQFARMAGLHACFRGDRFNHSRVLVWIVHTKGAKLFRAKTASQAGIWLGAGRNPWLTRRLQPTNNR